MAIEIQHGLFVGVDRYAQLPPSERLEHASKDASSLYEYFRAARPAGVWRKLVSTKTKLPRQVDILTALTDFANNVPSGETGLFYFSGHASASERGLVLKSYDAHDRFPIDSGVRLARALEIMKAKAGEGKRFLLILDCCRDSAQPAVADDIPPNVCILYASGIGQPAFESSHGGVLTRSFIESMEAVARETGAGSCSLKTLCNRLSRQLFGWRPASALAVELHGNWADLIHLPIVRGGVTSLGPEAAGPTAVLKYYFGSEQEYRDGFNTLASRIFQWYGIHQNSQGGLAFVQEHFDGPANSTVRLDEITYFFQVRIPDRCVHWTSSDFLVHLLESPLTTSETIIFRWPSRIEHVVFKELRHAIGGEWVGGPDDEQHGLFWKHESEYGKYRGLAWIRTDTPDETSVTVRCETTDSYEMPLRYLLPGLRDVYDLILSIRR